MPTTPAGDASLAEAARLAGSQPVGSHHLLLAALADPDSAAARTLTALGVNLDQAREALRNAEVAGTSDEQLEERGRRHMVIRVTSESLTIEATDPAIVALARAAIEALGGQAQDARRHPGRPAGQRQPGPGLAGPARQPGRHPRAGGRRRLVSPAARAAARRRGGPPPEKPGDQVEARPRWASPNTPARPRRL